MRGSKESPFFRIFDYTAAQWDQIEKTLTTRATPDATASGAMEKACLDLRNSACLYLLRHQNPPTANTKDRAKLWREIANLSNALMSKLSDFPFDEQWNINEYHEGLSGLWIKALSHLAEESEQRQKMKQKALKPKARYQFEVLDVWTSLGGNLGIAHGSRVDVDKVTGPLSRYFAAVTGPVCGGSLLSLKDIRESYRKAVRDGSWHQCRWRQWRWSLKPEAPG